MLFRRGARADGVIAALPSPFCLVDLPSDDER
jgi:hypothetical protein